MCRRRLGCREPSGLRVWYDRDYISAGDRIREKINKGIKKSPSFLLLASRHSLKCRWLLNELDVAMVREIEERRKVVIPMRGSGSIRDTGDCAGMKGQLFVKPLNTSHLKSRCEVFRVLTAPS
jgi:TIR domain